MTLSGAARRQQSGARVADGYTILVIALTGNATGTFDGPFTETDHEVIRPGGSATLLGTGTQFGTLGTCGTGPSGT
jgi:hypothetical protein